MGSGVQAGGDQVHQVHPGVETAEGADHAQRGEADQTPQHLGPEVQRSQPGDGRTDRQTDRQVDRQTDRRTDRQTDRDCETGRHTG